MISKKHADLLSDSMLTQAREEALERRNNAARPVSYPYRFPDLGCFERWQRPLIVNEARKHAMRQTPVIVVWVISSAIAISFALSYIYPHRADEVTIVCLAVMASFAPVFLYHREVMKKYVTKKRKVHESEVRNGD